MRELHRAIGALCSSSIGRVSPVSTSVRVGSNLGYRVILVEDACDCFDLPDGRGGTVRAEEIHRAHVATLRHEFATVLRTADVLASL